MDFKLHSEYAPTGDQPQAIDELSNGVMEGVPYQTLLGVTGSGKTFTMANIIQRTGKPTLILSHNKTLAAQLYSEFKSFSPKTRCTISCRITTIISLKPTSLRRTNTLRKTCKSTRKSTVCASARSQHCFRADATSSWWPR